MTGTNLEHVVCGHCDPATYICGTPREDGETIVDMDHPHEAPACAVCFARAKTKCRSCDVTITNIRPPGVDLSPVRVRKSDWFANGLGVIEMATRSRWQSLLEWLRSRGRP